MNTLEQRIAKRVPIDFKISYTIEGETKKGDGAGVNISETGISFKAKALLPAQKNVYLNFNLADFPVVALKGKIMWSQPIAILPGTFMVGIQFEFSEEWKKIMIRKYVEKTAKK